MRRYSGTLWFSGSRRYTCAVRFKTPSIFVVIYIVVGLIVAQQHHYFNNVGTIERFFSAVLAILLWWLVPLHVNLHLK